LEEANISFRRPSDYFCEHLKTDAHMAKVAYFITHPHNLIYFFPFQIKDRLILEEKKIQAFEERKQRDFTRKHKKQAGAVSKKSRPSSSAAAEEQPPSGSGNSRNSNSQASDAKKKQAYPEKSKKRQAMDKKYGFGGKDKRKSKSADYK